MKCVSPLTGTLTLGIIGCIAIAGCSSLNYGPLTEGPQKPDGVHPQTNYATEIYVYDTTPNNNNVAMSTVKAPQAEPAPKKAEPAPAPAPKKATPPPADTKREGGLIWTTMCYPTGDPKTSAICIEKGVPAQVRAGQPFEYQIIATNKTQKQLDGVVVTDTVNNNFKFTRSAPEGSSNAAGVMSWNLGDFGPGEAKTIRVNGSAVGEGAINSCCTCTYNSSLCASIAVVSPKLQLVKTGPAEVMKCDTITYTFEVANVGSGSIDNIRIADALPTGLMTADNKKAIDIAVGTLAAGQSKKFTANVKADKAGTYDNKASATADGVVADSSLVTTTVRQPVLTVDLECPENTLIGREITYKATVKSTGDVASASTVLTLNLPAGATFVKADSNGASSAGKATWNLGSINANDSRAVTVTVRPVNAGAQQVTATVQGACAAAATDSCSVTIQGVPDIGTALSDDDGVAMVGDNHTFNYEVENQGQVDLTNVIVALTLTEGLQYVSTTATGQPKASGRTVEINLGTVKPGQKVAFNIVAKGLAAGEQGINSETRSDQLKRAVTNQEQVTFIER